MPIKERDLIPMSDPRVSQIGHPAPPWLVNYADLMTELVCFFVILYALSAALNKDVSKAKQEVQEVMAAEKIQGDIKVSKEGMMITLQESGDYVFFQSGSADLSPQMAEVLEKIAPSLEKLAEQRHDIIVEGHTDDVPIHNARFSSNWELSTARATSVVRHMIRDLKFPPERLAAIGYGEHRPLAANDSPENRIRNRRVVFFVKNAPQKFKPAEIGGDKKETAPPPAAAPSSTSEDWFDDTTPAAAEEPVYNEEPS